MTATGRIIAASAAGLLALGALPGVADAGKRPNLMKGCVSCHQAAEGTIRGKMVSVSEKFGSFNVTVGPLVWIVKYGPDLKVKEGEKLGGSEALTTIPRDKEILVTFTGDESAPTAVQVAVKQPYKVPEEKLVSVEKMQELVALGPEKGGFTLVDSRPPSVYPEGHIPGALSLPYGTDFKEKAAGKLPADKGSLLIFYCGGFT